MQENELIAVKNSFLGELDIYLSSGILSGLLDDKLTPAEFLERLYKKTEAFINVRRYQSTEQPES